VGLDRQGHGISTAGGRALWFAEDERKFTHPNGCRRSDYTVRRKPGRAEKTNITRIARASVFFFFFFARQIGRAARQDRSLLVWYRPRTSTDHAANAFTSKALPDFQVGGATLWELRAERKRKFGALSGAAEGSQM